MALPKQTERREIIRKMRKLGWTGPVTGPGKHPHMVKGKQKQRVPNEHGESLDVSLLSELLRKAGISHDEWNNA